MEEQKSPTSKYRGVSWHKHNKKWQAQLKIKGKRYHLGYFTDEKQAAKAFKIKIKQLSSTLRS